MKRCPECRRDYYDDSLLYCLDDGSALLEGPATGEGRAGTDEPATAILPGVVPPRSAARSKGATARVSKLTVTLILAILALAAFGLYQYTARSNSTVPHFKNVELKRITTEGGVESVAISPDGKYVAYTLEESGKRSLWTKHLATQSQVQIAAPVESISMYASCFSPDGGYVYYTRQDDQNPRGALYVVPVLGGASRKIVNDVSQPVAVSRDGKQIIFGRFKLTGTDDHLMLADSNGANERLLLTVSEPAYLQGSSAAWSPDGSRIAIGYGDVVNDDSGPSPVYKMKVAVVALADPAFKTITAVSWGNIGNMVWFNDGSGLAFVAGERRSGAKQIWQCSYPSGEASRITNDLNSYDFESLSLTVDDTALAAVQKHPRSQIWVVPDGDTGKARPIVSRKNVQDGGSGVAWTPDGRIVYDSVADANSSIWSVKADGTDPRPLTNGSTDDFSPEVSPDGRHVIFGAVRNGFQVWQMDIDGANARQITFATGAPTFSYSPDGKWVITNPYLGGIYKQDLNGGEPVQLVKDGALVYPQVSPDGSMLAYQMSDKDTKRPKIIVIGFEGGSMLNEFDLPVSSVTSFFDSLSYRGFHWSPDGKGIVYIDTIGGVSNLWRLPMDGGPARKITDFTSDRIYSFAFASDGRTLALARGSNTPDAVLITDLR